MSEKKREGLILLKCRGCKQPTVFKLWFCHEADKGWTANTHCRSCESKQSSTRMTVRSLHPTLVEKQRLDPVCHEPDHCVEPDTDQ